MADDNRFTKVATDRFMYNPNKGCKKKLIGHLLNLVPMPPLAGKDWNAFLIKTTEVTDGLDRESNIVEVPIDSEVLIPATNKLLAHFERASAHPKVCFEVSIDPIKKIDLGKGKTMWVYDLGVDLKHPKERREFGLAGLLEQNMPAPAQLAAGAAAVEGVDDIPF